MAGIENFLSTVKKLPFGVGSLVKYRTYLWYEEMQWYKYCICMSHLYNMETSITKKEFSSPASRSISFMLPQVILIFPDQPYMQFL